MADALPANPYAPTAAPLGGEFPDLEAFRRQYLKHEASVKSIGVLYYLGSFLLLIAAPVLFASAFVGDVQPAERAMFLVIAVFYTLIGAFQGWVGYGIRRLRGWARIVGIVLSSIGLLAFPIGTLINGYILYLLASAKGSVVFSDHYRTVIEATPHVRYKSSLAALVLLAFLIVVLFFGIVALALSV